MKLFAVLSSLLLFGQVYCEPCLLGGVLGTATGLVGTVLGGGGYNRQQRYLRRVPASAPAPAPAASPTVNVNVQNIYNKQNNKEITNNKEIGIANNNVVNNDVNVKQDVNNKAISNEYNNREINNKQVNNYGGAYSKAPAQQTREARYEPAPRYDAGYENEREQSYKSRDTIQAEREREYYDKSRSRGNYQAY